MAAVTRCLYVGVMAYVISAVGVLTLFGLVWWYVGRTGQSPDSHRRAGQPDDLSGDDAALRAQGKTAWMRGGGSPGI